MSRLISHEDLRDWVDSQPVAGDLTAFTGRRRFEEATTYVGSFEVSQTGAIVVVLSFVFVGLPFTGLVLALATLFVPADKCWWLLPLPAVISAVALWLFVARERRGLRLLRYQGILDRRRAAESQGRLFIGVHPVQPAQLAELIPVVIDTPERLLPDAADAVVPGARQPGSLRSAITAAVRRPALEPTPVATGWDPAPGVPAPPADPWSTQTGKEHP